MPMRTGLPGVYASYFDKPGLRAVRGPGGPDRRSADVPRSIEIWQALRNSWTASVVFDDSDRAGARDAAEPSHEILAEE